MLIAGDVGGAMTPAGARLAAGRPSEFVAEQEFSSADYKGLRPVVEGRGGRPPARYTPAVERNDIAE